MFIDTDECIIHEFKDFCLKFYKLGMSKEISYKYGCKHFWDIMEKAGANLDFVEHETLPEILKLLPKAIKDRSIFLLRRAEVSTKWGEFNGTAKE